MGKTICITGSQGFIGGYLCRALLNKGYSVIGIDNYSKYGPIKRDYDNHPNFTLLIWDMSDRQSLKNFDNLLLGCDYLIACAAMIGGISYFHKYAYDLLAHNERVIANTFDSAIKAHKNGLLKCIIVVSSSMVYEGADQYADHIGESPWPSMESDIEILPPPYSTYGMNKLMTEYFCKGAWEQYGLPYTIVRPFNCVGLGEEEAIGEEEILSGNIKLMMSHVLPDLANKVIKGQDPLHILGEGNQVRCYTHGKDIANGIVLAMESPNAENEAFNISTSRETTVLELAELVWKRVHGNTKPFRYVCDEPFKYDVQMRIPDVEKASYLLGWDAKISLEESVDEVVGDMLKRANNV